MNRKKLFSAISVKIMNMVMPTTVKTAKMAMVLEKKNMVMQKLFQK